MDISLNIKDAIAAGGVLLTALAMVWNIRGQASKVAIAISQVKSSLDSLTQRIDREERKSSRAHERIDLMADKVTRLEVIQDQTGIL